MLHGLLSQKVFTSCISTFSFILERSSRSEQSEIRREQNEMRSDQDRGRKWEDRTWDVIKWVGGISAALSTSAAIALVGLVIRLSLSQ